MLYKKLIFLYIYLLCLLIDIIIIFIIYIYIHLHILTYSFFHLLTYSSIFSIFSLTFIYLFILNILVFASNLLSRMLISNLFIPLHTFTPHLHIPLSNTSYYLFNQITIDDKYLSQFFESFFKDVYKVFNENTKFNQNYVIITFFFYFLIHSNQKLKEKLFTQFKKLKNINNFFEYILSLIIKNFYHSNIFECSYNCLQYLILTYKLKKYYTSSFLNSIVFITSLTSNLFSDLFYNFLIEFNLLPNSSNSSYTSSTKQRNSFYGLYGLNSVLFYYYSKLFRTNFSTSFNLLYPSFSGYKYSLLEPSSNLGEFLNTSNRVNLINIEKMKKSFHVFSEVYYFCHYLQYQFIKLFDYNTLILFNNILQLFINDTFLIFSSSSLTTNENFHIKFFFQIFLPLPISNYFTFFNISNELGSILNTYFLESLLINQFKIEKFLNAKQSIIDFFSNLF